MLTDKLDMLADQQEKAVEEELFHIYKGLCMQEAALLRSYAKAIKNEGIQQTLLQAANDAMKRALAFDTTIN